MDDALGIISISHISYTIDFRRIFTTVYLCISNSISRTWIIHLLVIKFNISVLSAYFNICCLEKKSIRDQLSIKVLFKRFTEVSVTGHALADSLSTFWLLWGWLAVVRSDLAENWNTYEERQHYYYHYCGCPHLL